MGRHGAVEGRGSAKGDGKGVRKGGAARVTVAPVVGKIVDARRWMRACGRAGEVGRVDRARRR